MLIAQDEDGHEKKNTQQLLLLLLFTSLDMGIAIFYFYVFFYVNYIALWFSLP